MVRMTADGNRVIRLTKTGKTKVHRNGVEWSDTGIVVADQRKGGCVRVRLDSEPAASSGEYYAANFWTHVPKDDSPTRCYVCEEPTNRADVFRVISRGDKQGTKVGPLCADCESFMYTNALLED